MDTSRVLNLLSHNRTPALCLLVLQKPFLGKPSEPNTREPAWAWLAVRQGGHAGGREAGQADKGPLWRWPEATENRGSEP